MRCMTDSKKKRHQVSCIQCQKPMEVVENRFKARSFFLCSAECANDLYSKQRQATREKNRHRRLEKKRERLIKRRAAEEEAKTNPNWIWIKKAKQESLKAFVDFTKSEWERKSIAAVATMRKRESTIVCRPEIIVDWLYWVNACQARLVSKSKRQAKSDWYRKCETSSNNLKRRGIAK